MYKLGIRIRALYIKLSSLTTAQKLKVAYFILGVALAVVIGLFAANLNATSEQGHQTAIALKDYEHFGAQRRSLNNENLRHIKIILTALSTDFKAACEQTENVNRAIRFTIHLSIAQSEAKTHKHLNHTQRAEVKLILNKFKPINCSSIPGGVTIKLK